VVVATEARAYFPVARQVRFKVALRLLPPSEPKEAQARTKFALDEGQIRAGPLRLCPHLS
jgi:hypothetical protein